MKLILTILFAASFHGLCAEVDRPQDIGTRILIISKLMKLVDSNQAEFSKLQSMSGKSKSLSGIKKARYKELSEQRASTYQKVLDLRGHIKKGTSIFDYRGILALGHIRHHTAGYTLTIPAGVAYGRPAPLEIRFNNEGKVLTVWQLKITK